MLSESTTFKICREQWQKVNDHLGLQNGITFDEYFDNDGGAQTNDKLTDAEIIGSRSSFEGVDDTNVEEEDGTAPNENISVAEVKTIVYKFKSFFEKCDNTSDNIFDYLINVDNTIESEKVERPRQVKISTFSKR